MDEQLKTMWAFRSENHIYIVWRGQIIYKSYDQPGHPSVLFNEVWPNVWITDKNDNRRAEV